MQKIRLLAKSLIWLGISWEVISGLVGVAVVSLAWKQAELSGTNADSLVQVSGMVWLIAVVVWASKDSRKFIASQRQASESEATEWK